MEDNLKRVEGKKYNVWIESGVWLTCFFIKGKFYPTQIPAQFNEPVVATRIELIK
jgi:hypothetical protein